MVMGQPADIQKINISTDVNKAPVPYVEMISAEKLPTHLKHQLRAHHQSVAQMAPPTLRLTKLSPIGFAHVPMTHAVQPLPVVASSPVVQQTPFTKLDDFRQAASNVFQNASLQKLTSALLQGVHFARASGGRIIGRKDPTKYNHHCAAAVEQALRQAGLSVRGLDAHQLAPDTLSEIGFQKIAFDAPKKAGDLRVIVDKEDINPRGRKKHSSFRGFQHVDVLVSQQQGWVSDAVEHYEQVYKAVPMTPDYVAYYRNPELARQADQTNPDTDVSLDDTSSGGISGLPNRFTRAFHTMASRLHNSHRVWRVATRAHSGLRGFIHDHRYGAG